MAPLATVGILSIGEMGMGIAKLLVAHNYRVVTNIAGRSEDTQARAQKSNIETVPTDISLVETADYILSIVPPRDALATAKRITTAFNSTTKQTPLYYLDLNAISPRSARAISDLFQTSAPAIRFIDGAIIGGAPSLLTSTSPLTSSSPQPPSSSSSSPTTDAPTWKQPSIPVCGPHELSSSPISGSHLSSTLNLNHISPTIGAASGLKCCFASMTKGFTALCIQSFTTASNMGVLDLLVREAEDRIPGLMRAARGGVTGMGPKAYRWEGEMEEIGTMHGEEGGFGIGFGRGVFGEIAGVYRRVAEETVLGEEKGEGRKRGRTIEDVAVAMGEGLSKRRKGGES